MNMLQAFAMIALTALPAVALADVTLVRDGKPLAKIYIAQPVDTTDAIASDEPRVNAQGKAVKKAPTAADPENALRALAVKEVIEHLTLMSGAAPQVVVTDDPAKIERPAIVLGSLAEKLGAAPTKKSESLEGFRLIVKDDLVLIAGQSERGMLFGVYELLTSLGCDWVMPGKIGQIVPRRDTVIVADRDTAQSPDFVTRRFWYRGYYNKDHPLLPGEFERFELWLLRQRGGAFPTAAQQTAGHEWDGFIRRNKAEIEKDPTILALTKNREGKLVRKGPQLEANHPRVAELYAAEIKAKYEQNIAAGKWTKETAAGFPIGPSDGLGYSVSPEAIAAGSGKIDPIVGANDETDVLILLANRILEKIKPLYPNALVGFYSYSTHAGFPTRYVPDPSIALIFAPINFSRFHSVIDPNSRTQAYYRAVVEKWGELSKKQGNPLLYRGYNWNLADNLLPYTKARIWGEELPFYKRLNFNVMNVEGTKMWGVLAPGDYIFMRLCWDTSLDWKKLLHEYCAKAYGKGGPLVEEYQHFLIERQSSAKQEAGSFHAFPLIYSEADVAKMLDLLSRARAAADNDADRTRIEYMTSGPEMLRHFLAFHRASLAFDFSAAKAGLEAMRAHWDKVYAQNSDQVANEGPAYIRRFLMQFAEKGLAYSTPPYAIVEKIPDELPTRFDNLLTGYTEKLFEADVDEKTWQRTKTVSSTWDAQRLSDDHRVGGVWYRHRFTLPASAKGQGVGLFLGGFEDEARVWVNGQLIGTSGTRFSNPAEFDLTDAVKADGSNVLAIQVVRNSAANEIGLGGLIRPSFIFVGPRLEKKAPGETELRRVLPGGELGEIEK